MPLASSGNRRSAGLIGVSFFSQLIITTVVIVFCLIASTLVYGILKKAVGIRLSAHEELRGSDLSVHMIEANPEEAM